MEKQKCVDCGKEDIVDKLFEVDKDVEKDGKWMIETDLVCGKCFFKNYIV